MKKKIFSISMIVVLVLSSMLLSVAPASAASLAWSTQGIPSVLTSQLAATSDTALVTVAPNGDIYAVDQQTAPAIAPLVYKSVDGGRTWALPASVGVAGDVIVDMAVSPSYETDSTVMVLVAGNPAQVYISENGGISFVQLGAALPVAAEVGTSLAISPTYAAGNGEVMVGTQNPAAATFGDVYVWGQIGAPYVWTPKALGEDVTAVAFSPNYPIDFTILAVGSTAAATNLHTKVSTAAWDATVGTGVNPAPGPVPLDTATAAGIIGFGDVGSNILSADIALPSDFTGSIYPVLTVAYVAVRSVNPDDKVFRCTAGSAVAGAAMDPNTPSGLPAAGDDEITSLAFAGASATGTLFAGSAGVIAASQVYRITSPASPLSTWAGAAPGPSGTPGGAGTQQTYVALPPDFSTSNRVYAGTLGVNSALSRSDDGGMTFYQAGLIDTNITSVNDFQAASSSELFMFTNDGAGTADSLWKSMDGGLTWYRYMTVVTAANNGIIRLSPSYDTDQTVWFANVGSALAANIMMSNNGGINWMSRNSPIAPTDLAVKDQYTLFVGGAGVQSTFNAGWTWQIAATASGAVNDIELDTGTGHLLVGTAAGGVMRSIDNNISYLAQGAIAGVVGGASVAFDANYSDNNLIYAVDTGAVTGAGADLILGTADDVVAAGAPGVWRFDTGAAPGTPWVNISTLALNPMDIAIAPDGTLYASDTSAASGTAGGIVRSLNPTNPIVVTSERVSDGVGGDGLVAGDTLSLLSLVEGSNIIWAVNVAAVRTYTDTLSVVTPVQTGPAPEAILDSTTVMFTWDAVAGGTFYDVQYGTRSDWIGSVTATTPNMFDTFLRVPGLTTGATYYWRVRVNSPVLSPYSETHTFIAQLGVTGPTAPALVVTGPTAPGGTNAPLMPSFQWAAVKGATGYDFQLATDAGMDNRLYDEALGAVNVYTATSPLDYSTTYYWRVRAISATSTTDWSSVAAFTTMDEPEDPSTQPVPTVIVPTQEAPIINVPTQPAPIITIEAGDADGDVAPGYIWAVIIIGAVLVIALIVLIVRTRRTV